MDVAAIQNELEALSPEQQDRVSAFLAVLRLKRDGLLEEISRRLDDSNPESWVAWADLKDDLNEDPSGTR